MAASTLILVALIVIAGDAIIGRRRLARVGPWLIITPATYGLIGALYPQVAPWAALVLAIGISVSLMRVRARWLPWLRAGARWQIPAAATLLASWALGVPLVRQWQERQATTQLSAAAPDAPNVLLIIWDTVRAYSVSLYGYERPTTPELTEFARSGTVFENAFATSSWSLPSHASMYTGRDAHEIEINRDVPMDGTYPTLAEVLRRHGYVTAGFTGNLFYGSRDFGIARGFAWYDDEAPRSLSKFANTWSLTRRVLRRWRRSRGIRQEIVRRPGSDVTASFLSWVDRSGSRPFFASLNYFDAHEPYLAPEPYNLAFSQRQPRYWEGDERPTDPAVLSELQTAYESCILYVDSELRRLLDAMRERGALDNTLVIITSDHGEQFGDHGAHLFGHERSLYASVLHVPMIVVFPGRIPAGTRRSEVVSLRDIPATVMDALGLPPGNVFPGASLLQIANGRVDPDASEPRLAHLRPNKFYPAEMDWANREQHRVSVTVDSLHYLINASGEEELYDFIDDPWETDNLADDSASKPILQRLREVVDARIPDSLRTFRSGIQ